MKSIKYHTVRTIPKFNRKILETEANSIHIAHISWPSEWGCVVGCDRTPLSTKKII